MANLTKDQLKEKDTSELKALAKNLKIKDISKKTNDELIYAILDAKRKAFLQQARLKNAPSEQLKQRHKFKVHLYFLTQKQNP